MNSFAAIHCVYHVATSRTRMCKMSQNHTYWKYILCRCICFHSLVMWSRFYKITELSLYQKFH